jgi:hypothetical protein
MQASLLVMAPVPPEAGRADVSFSDSFLALVMGLHRAHQQLPVEHAGTSVHHGDPPEEKGGETSRSLVIQRITNS